MPPLPAQLRVSPRPSNHQPEGCSASPAQKPIVRVQGGGEGRASGPVGSADGEIGGFVNQTAYLDEIKEDGRIDGPRSRGGIVAICETLENFRRQLEPRAVERRNVAPMSSERAMSAKEGRWISWQHMREGMDRCRGAYLLRQMISAEVDGSGVLAWELLDDGAGLDGCRLATGDGTLAGDPWRPSAASVFAARPFWDLFFLVMLLRWLVGRYPAS